MPGDPLIARSVNATSPAALLVAVVPPSSEPPPDGDRDRDHHALAGDGGAVRVLELERRLRIERDAGGGDGLELRGDHQPRREAGAGESGVVGNPFDRGNGEVGGGLGAQDALRGCPPLSVGRAFRRIHAAAAFGRPLDDHLGHGLAEPVGHLHDQSLAQGLADGAVLLVAAEDLHLRGFALTREG